MGFLDKLRPQPRWKHQDAAVRLDAVRELEDPLELAPLAESDPEAKVRRAAIAKIADVDVLGRVAGSDADPEVRDRAADRLLSIATAGDTAEATAVAATESLSDVKRLSTIAKSDVPAPVRTGALARISDERALGAVARHAKHEDVAAAALGRLKDDNELLEVALNSEHKDVAAHAFERAAGSSTDLSLLRSIESRAQHKTVSKRARTLVQQIEDAEAARLAAIEAHRRKQAAAAEAVDRVADLTDIARATTELARLEETWRDLGAAGITGSETGMGIDTDPAVAQRFERGVAAAHAAIADRQRLADELAEQARARTEALATREALCVRVETLVGDDVVEQLVPIEEEWRSLAPLVGNGPEADRLAERFVKAVAACRKRHELGAVLVETRARLESLVGEAEGLLSAEVDAAAAATRWQALNRETRGLAASLASADRPAADLLERLAVVDQGFAAREAAKREAAFRAEQEFVGRLQRLAERTRRAAEAEAITLREGERLMRDLGAAFEEIGRADSREFNKDTRKEIDDVTRMLRTLQEQVAPRVRDLREMDEWRRFANAQRQEQLIAMAEAIVASLKAEVETGKTSDLAATARALKELHAKWGEVAEAPRQSAQKLWDRFRLATDFIRARCESYFKKMREERTVNLQKRASLVEESEALAQSTDWGKATARFRELQAEWQQAGPAPRDQAQDLSQRFRTACNLFFARRRDDLLQRKNVWTDNLAKKEALCQRAEALAESTDWDAAVSEMKRLQAEWKAIGAVRRNKSETIWNRFRAAADKFFERYHNRHQINFANKLAEREAMVVELEGYAASEDVANPAELVEQIKTLRTTWSRSVPIPGNEMKVLAERWQAAFTRTVTRWPEAFAGTDFDPALVRQRLEKLVAKVEGFVVETRDPDEGKSQTELLAARLRSALASNAMGGRVNEDARWRAAAEAIKDAQAAWDRQASLAGADAKALEGRFRDAVRRVNDQIRKHTGGGGKSRPPQRQTAAAV